MFSSFTVSVIERNTVHGAQLGVVRCTRPSLLAPVALLRWQRSMHKACCALGHQKSRTSRCATSSRPTRAALDERLERAVLGPQVARASYGLQKFPMHKLMSESRDFGVL